MAETIVSPGVFTRENDLSFLPQGIGAIGACIIGPTVKGPAFVPTVIRRGFSEFEQRFGGLSPVTYVPQTVKEYLRNAGAVTVVRVLAGGGHNFDPTAATGMVGIALSGSFGNTLLATFKPSKGDATGLDQTTLDITTNKIGESFALNFSGSGFENAKTYSSSLVPTNVDFVTKTIGTTPWNSKTGANAFADGAFTYNIWKTLATNINNTTANETFKITFPSFTAGITPIGQSVATNAGYVLTSSLNNITLAASGAFYMQTGDGIYHTVGFDPTENTKIAGGITPNTGLSGSYTAIDLETTFTPTWEGGSANHALGVSASAAQLATNTAAAINGISGFTATADSNVVTVVNDIAGTAANVSTTMNDGTSTSASVATTVEGAYLDGYSGHSNDRMLTIVTQSAAFQYTSSYAEGYDHARTPWIQSQYQNGTTTNLFKFHTLADGTSTNTDFKVSIAGLKEPSDIDGVEQYSTFNVMVRRYSDKDARPVILEQFNNCNLDPDSPNYISRVIGDRYAAYDTTFGKVLTYGDYTNLSKLIRVEVTDAVKEKSTSPKLSPKGFAAVLNPVPGASFTPGTVTIPSASYKTSQDIGGVYNGKAFLGWKFTNEEVDNENWIKPLPSTEESNVAGAFNVEDYSVHPSSSITWEGSLSASIDVTGTSGPTKTQLQFSVPFQGGYDGDKSYTIPKVGEYMLNTNCMGMDLSTTTAVGYKGYKKAIDIMSNQDEYDINMLVLPGVIKKIHSSVTDAATTMAEDRGDTFYVMDLAELTSTVSTAVNEAASLDSNYAAVYYPWVKVLDTSINKPVFVPPSVIVPGAIAASDNISAEWFAPAGLNRGVLGAVLEAKIRLNQAERDELYEGKVNPIATFPRTGVCIWGQKTLQTKPTALDRINVRRLLIAVKKFIASSSKYLVFEQNTVQTRNRFLNIVNPYLESVQQRQGLYAFKVVMDESNNTPEEIDRNRLIGAIYLQPTKTAEFIVLDFNVLPTGATFDA